MRCSSVKFRILVVLYNKKIDESETLHSLASSTDLLINSSIIFWDNSPLSLSKDELLKLETLFNGINYEYRWGEGKNYSLSVIYNQIIQTVDEEEYLLLFDHDSTFDKSFFEELIKSIEEHSDIVLFLPIVYSHNKIVSPATKKFVRGFYWKKESLGLKKIKNITAINSGMAIAGSFLKKEFEGYNENLKFYGTDDDFMLKYSKKRQEFVVTESKIYHILNFFEEEPFDIKHKRLKELRRSSRIVMKQKGLLYYAATYFYCLFYSIKIAIKYKDIRYIN